MNYLKVIKTVAGLTAFAGFFLMVGTTGRSDYMDAIGAYYPVTEMFPQMLIGLAMFAGGAFVAKKCDPDVDEDWEDWEDEIYED